MINVLSDNSHSKILVDNKGDEEQGFTTKEAKPKGPKKPRTPSVRKFEQVECPICGKGHILKGKTAFGCSRFREGCSLRLNFEQYPEDLTPAKLKKLLQKK